MCEGNKLLHSGSKQKLFPLQNFLRKSAPAGNSHAACATHFISSCGKETGNGFAHTVPLAAALTLSVLLLTSTTSSSSSRRLLPISIRHPHPLVNLDKELQQQRPNTTLFIVPNRAMPRQEPREKKEGQCHATSLFSFLQKARCLSYFTINFRTTDPRSTTMAFPAEHITR
mmetsp:Transcript_13664/g.27071  ORF Transcript_13664/g.27071 Transcript_13664/m.27071 type:complete len:171 (+) Transcript_13664:1410-1922(+)